MNFALQALLLIRLEARQGEWVSVLELAEHYSIKLDFTAQLLAGLADRNLVRVDRVNGQVMRAMAIPKAGDGL